MKMIELRGIPALYAVQAFHKLMLGLKMLPSYMHESYEAFFERLDHMSESEQETMIREAAVFVKLDLEEMSDLCRFAADPNGVPYTAENMKKLSAEDIHDIIVAVSFEILKAHKIRLVSDSEKKN